MRAEADVSPAMAAGMSVLGRWAELRAECEATSMWSKQRVAPWVPWLREQGRGPEREIVSPSQGPALPSRQRCWAPRGV